MDPKTQAWREAAHNVIVELAASNSLIVSDMVVAALEQAGMGLDNYSALGGVFTRAAKAGLIVKTDETAPGNRKSHSAKTVWRSLTYKKAETGNPEQNAISGMIINALEYNAATVRYASLIYDKQELDNKTLKRAIKDFNEMADVYQAKNAAIMDDLQKALKGKQHAN